MREKKYGEIRPNWMDITPGLLRRLTNSDITPFLFKTGEQ
jgi:hypothetical protein